MDDDLRQTSIHLPESLVDALDEAVADAPDYLSLSRSEMIRYAIEQGVEGWSGEVLDLIPDEMLARYRTKRETARIKAEHYVVDKREGWRGRVKAYLSARLAGDEPYHPHGIEILANGYRDEVEMLDRLAPESSRTVEEDFAWLDEAVADYREAYQAKQVLPDDRPFEGVSDKISTGRDLLALRGNFGSLVSEIQRRAEAEAYDPDAIIRALASDYDVSEDAIEVAVDVLIPDGQDPRRALADLESSSIDEILPPDAVATIDDAEIPEIQGETVLGGPGETMAIRAEDLGRDPEIDEGAVETIVESEIRSDGGLSDD